MTIAVAMINLLAQTQNFLELLRLPFLLSPLSLHLLHPAQLQETLEFLVAHDCILSFLALLALIVIVIRRPQALLPTKLHCPLHLLPLFTTTLLHLLLLLLLVTNLHSPLDHIPLPNIIRALLLHRRHRLRCGHFFDVGDQGIVRAYLGREGVDVVHFLCLCLFPCLFPFLIVGLAAVAVRVRGIIRISARGIKRERRLPPIVSPARIRIMTPPPCSLSHRCRCTNPPLPCPASRQTTRQLPLIPTIPSSNQNLAIHPPTLLHAKQLNTRISIHRKRTPTAPRGPTKIHAPFG
mmetsp:Transcript_38050/g.83563  ORF Transcript_38050/g.83563 Transcript_38050/m.83563 type:complete len:293 (-) Transcript_38050:356-1234(-)